MIAVKSRRDGGRCNFAIRLILWRGGLLCADSDPSPQIVGTIVTWVAAATGGVTPYQFQWALYQAGSWTVGAWRPSR